MPVDITRYEAMRMALIDAIEARSSLAAGDRENRDMHTAYVAAYRNLLEEFTGSKRTPIEQSMDNMEPVSLWKLVEQKKET